MTEIQEGEWSARRIRRLGAVLEYVKANPGCTARNVAVHVMGGTGATRTSSRGAAYTDLVQLERDGLVVREKGTEHRWSALERGDHGP